MMTVLTDWAACSGVTTHFFSSMTPETLHKCVYKSPLMNVSKFEIVDVH